MIDQSNLNQPITLEQAYSVLQIPLNVRRTDKELELVEHVYLANHTTRDGESSYWLTVLAKDVSGVCIAAGSEMDKSDICVMYAKLLDRALGDIVAKLNGTYIAKPMVPQSIEKVAQMLASFMPRETLPECQLPTDGTDIPVEAVVEWYRSTGDESHGTTADLIADTFDAFQFLLFPDGKSMAAVGMLKKERTNLHVCFNASEGLIQPAKAVHLLLREAAYMKSPGSEEYIVVPEKAD